MSHHYTQAKIDSLLARGDEPYLREDKERHLRSCIETMTVIIRQLLRDHELLKTQRAVLEKEIDSLAGYLHIHNMTPKHWPLEILQKQLETR